MVAVFKYLKGCCHVEPGAELFKVVPEDRTKKSGITEKKVGFGWMSGEIS